jgi:hypothetical protein
MPDQKKNKQQKTKLKGGKVYFVSQCQPIDLGLRLGRVSWQQESVVEEAAHIMVAGKQRDRGRDQGHVLVSSSFFLQLGPTSKCFHHLPVMSSNNDSISGLIHC